MANNQNKLVKSGRWKTALSLTALLASTWLAQAAVLEFSSYLGGPQFDAGFTVIVDSQGNAYIAGGTESTNGFPILNAYQPDSGGQEDVFVCKFDPTGHLLFSTYLGGLGDDEPYKLALDEEGNLLIAGQTHSTDFPVSADAFQSDYGGGSAFGTGDGFLAKLSSDGRKLLYATYFGGSGDEIVSGLAVDISGNLIITGRSDSEDLPISRALQPHFGGGDSDGFVAQFDHSLTNLLFSTYLGGDNSDSGSAVAVDPVGNIYVVGETLSTSFPVTSGAFQTNHVVVEAVGENYDAFVVKISRDGAQLLYGTYIGDATDDGAYAIAVDSAGSAYLAGAISATWEPGTFALGFQPQPGFGGADAYVAKLKPDGSNFEWFSYLGGGGNDVGYGIALDAQTNVYVTGITDSRDFPIRDAMQFRFGGGSQDSFVTKVSADGKQLLYSSYLGGSGEEWGYDIAPGPDGTGWLVGETASTNFPTQEALQSTNSSLRTIDAPFDGYLVKLSSAVASPPLEVARSASNIVVSWSTNATGFVLETTGGLGTPDWQRAPGQPLTVGGRYTIIQKASGFYQFYRLKR